MLTLNPVTPKVQTDAPAWIWRMGLFTILGCLAAFALAKPYHMDDRGFLEAGCHILENFPHVYTGMRLFEGKPFSWALFPHPPFVPLYLAGWMAILKNPGTFALHLAFLPFSLLAAFSFYRVAQYCNVPPRWATLLFVGSPCFFVSAQSLMTDIPMIAFFLAALALYMEGATRNDLWLSICAGIAAFLAWFCRYPGILVVMIMMCHAWQTKSWKHCCIAGILPLMTFLLWTWGTAHASGQSHAAMVFSRFLNTSYHPFAAQALAARIVAFLSFLGGGIVFPPILLGLLLSHRPLSLRIGGIVIVLTLGILLLCARGFSWFATLLLGTCVASGTWLFCYSAKNPSLPGLWLIGVFTPLVAMTPFATVRYVLPMVPAACLVIIACIPQKPLRILLVLSAFVPSLLLSWTDGEVARGYRNIAQNLSGTKREPAHELYFSGEWGWRQAMEEAGGTYVVVNAQDFRPGDFLALPQEACPAMQRPERSKDWQIVERLELRTSLPLHLMHHPSHAGFYSHGWGLLPYSYSKQPSDIITIYRYEPHG